MGRHQTRLQLRLMSEDRVPTPPPADQGLPARPMPFQALPAVVQFARTKIQPGQEVPQIVLIYDTPDMRVISYWNEEDFTALAKNMLRFVGAPSLTVADITDLRDLDKIKDARPFEGPR